MGILDTLSDAASQVGGVFKGAGETLWETGEGLVTLGAGVVKTAYDASPAGLVVDAYEQVTGQQAPDWLPSAERGAQRVENAFEVAGTIARNPGLLVDAVVQPIVEDWNNGNYGEAIGRGAAELVLAVVGTKGIDKAAKGARVATLADDAADVGRVANRTDEVARLGHGLSRTQIDEIRAIPKGSRPDPSEYLSPSYISEHLALFDDGAARFMPRRNLEKYGIAQRDGTSFVIPKREADLIEAAANRGDLRYVEQALGLKEGFFADGGELMRIDIPNPREANLRIPSGNEAGASDLWLPGGRLPNGVPEAVVDGGSLPASRYSVRPVETGGSP